MDNCLYLQLDYNYVVDPLKCSIKLNNKILFDGILDRTEFVFHPVFDKHNCLQIYMHNKPWDGTKVDTHGNILADTFIRIQDIRINKRKLRYMIFDLGKCVFDDASKQSFTDYISKNGYYEINFTMPIQKFFRNYYSNFDSYNVEPEKEIKKIDELLCYKL